MNIIELTKVMDTGNTRSDKKICLAFENIMYFEEVPNGNGCTVIRYTNGTEIQVRETYKYLKDTFGA